jgi:sugar phosphate isomerase/epimerase
MHSLCKACIERWRGAGTMSEKDRITRDAAFERAVRIADIAAEEIVRSEGEPTGAPDEYRLPAANADEHIRECIEHLEYRGLALWIETDDGDLLIHIEEEQCPF